LLYSIALFDLAAGSLAISMPAYDDYWSVQVLPEDADNVVWRGGKGGDGQCRMVIDVPAHGVVVQRWLVRDDTDRARVDALRRRATIRHDRYVIRSIAGSHFEK
jgi:uncharacterized membrane protein